MQLRSERLNIQMLGSDAAVTSFELVNEERFGRRTIVWQKQQTGAWKIVHLHASNMMKGDD
jgi:ketosteroid isomerase-like protein